MATSHPRFVPIVSSYVTRVSGRGLPELLTSPAGLARALADTQRIVGHDGVLCFYAPQVIANSCVQSAAPASLCPAEAVPQSGCVMVIFEAIRALRTALPSGVQIFACFPGPVLTLTELRHSCGLTTPELEDYDYVGDVFISLVRAGCEAGAHGFALVESVPSEGKFPEGLYRSARKLADFYAAPFLMFLEPGSSPAEGVAVADFTFRLPLAPTGLELLLGMANGSDQGRPPVTTNRDVPVDVSVQELHALRELAMR